MSKEQTNIAFPQSGSRGAKPSYDMLLGQRDGLSHGLSWRDLLYLGGPTKQATWLDFEGSGTTLPSSISTDIASTGTVTRANSTLVHTTAATLNDHVTSAIASNWVTGYDWLYFDARVGTTAYTNVIIEVGLSDALSETGGVAFSDHTLAGVTDVATNALVFSFDTGGDATFNLCSVNAGTPSAISTGVTPANNFFYKFGLAISPDLDAHVFVNDEYLTTVTNAVATGAFLGLWFSVKALVAGAKTVALDYAGISQNR